MSKRKTQKPKLTPVFTMLPSALSIYWANIIKLIKMMLWGLIGLIPFVVLTILAFVLQNIWHFDGSVMQLVLAALIGLATLWLLYYFARVYMGFYLMVKNNFKKKTQEQFRETRSIVWSYIGLVLLIIVFLFPLLLISLAFLVSLNLLSLAPLVLITLLLVALILLAAVFVMAIFFGLAVFALVFENLNGPQALKRSIFLIEKYWWVVSGRILFIGFVFWFFSLIISLPLALVSETSSFFRAWNSIIGFVKILVAPIYLIYMSFVYKDLVKIKGAGSLK
ncbi:MAG: hypothetical protein NTX66_04370 [Candidatus Falkowbacteria bacterium]|nr:hypothetical protein [Candidatus Falkowbacteria bacterium]